MQMMNRSTDCRNVMKASILFDPILLVAVAPSLSPSLLCLSVDCCCCCVSIVIVV